MVATLFSAHKNEVLGNIAGIESQILRLQQELADQQSYLQGVAASEPAGQSALDQTANFLAMVRTIAPSQEKVFWAAMEALKNPENLATALEAAAAKREDMASEAGTDSAAYTVNAEGLDAGEVWDVEATTVSNEEGKVDNVPKPQLPSIQALSETESQPHQTPSEETQALSAPTLNGDADDGNGDGDGGLVTEEQLKALEWAVLQRLATEKRIADPSGQRLTRKFVQNALLGTLSWSELKPKMNLLKGS